MVEGCGAALALGNARRVGDGADAENGIGDIRAVSLVSAGATGIDFADSRVQPVVTERVGRVTWISDARNAAFEVVA